MSIPSAAEQTFSTFAQCANYLAAQHSQGQGGQHASQLVICNLTDNGKSVKITANLQFNPGNSVGQNIFDVKISGSNTRILELLGAKLIDRDLKVVKELTNYDGRDPANRSNPNWQGQIGSMIDVTGSGGVYTEERTSNVSPTTYQHTPSPSGATIKVAAHYAQVISGKGVVSATNMRRTETDTSVSESLSFSSAKACALHIAEEQKSNKATTIIFKLQGNATTFTCKVHGQSDKPIELSCPSIFDIYTLREVAGFLEQRGLVVSLAVSK